MKTHVVTRPLPLGKETLGPGAEVDASGWRNARLLEEQRYIKPIQAAAPETPQVTLSDERTARVGRKGKDESRD